MNVPKAARVIFAATPGYVMVEGDFNQIELRLIAYFSGDTALARIFECGQDGHLQILHATGQASGTLEELEQRFLAGDPAVRAARDECKRITYGWCYRMGARKLQLETGISYERAKLGLEALNTTFHGVVAWWDSVTYRANRQGYLENAFGRRRQFPDRDVPKICNFLPQSTAADVLYYVVRKHLLPALPPARLLNTIHDATLCEGPDGPRLVHVVRTAMEVPIPQLEGMTIPVKVKVGPNWGEMLEAH